MYKLQTLKNGLRFITVPMRGTKTATILVMVGTGSKYETKQVNGISHFLEHMFFKGTTKRPSTLAISSLLDSIGAEYNAFTSKEYTGYWVKVDSRKINVALDIVSDMLLNATLNTDEINRERGVIIEELNMYRDNPIMYIEDVFEECLYGDIPAGWDTIGTKKSILKVTRRDFLNYVSSQYGPKNIFICLVGNIKDNEVKIINAANRYFSSQEFTSRGIHFREKESVKEIQIKPENKIHYKTTDQAHLSLGVRTFGYDHKDRLIIKLMSIILGGSMSSRLFINLRERKGLAYYVRTNTEFYTDTGYITTRAGVPVDKLTEAIKIILAEYNKLRKALVSKTELQRAKDLLHGRMTIQFEASDNVANWYGLQLVMFNAIRRTKDKIKSSQIEEKLITPENYYKKINKVTASDIKRVANNIFIKKGLNFAVIGPYKNSKEFEKLLKL